MRLDEMADLVCSKVGKTDTESVALCKKFLARRYQLIYDSAFWRETQVLVIQDTSTVRPEQLVVKESIGRIIGIRTAPNYFTGGTGGDAMAVNEYGNMLLTDPGLFERTGTPMQFVRMPSLAVHSIQGFQFSFFSSSAQDAGKKIFIKGDIEDGEPSETVTLNGVLSVNAANVYSAPLVISKEATVGTVTVVYGDGFSSFYSYDLGPTVTQTKRYPRVALYPKPDTASAYLVMGKRRIEPLTEDGDEPLLTGCEDALIAHAQADMLEKARQYAKAELKRQEGMAQAQKFADLETDQVAHTTRIIPVAYEPDSLEWRAADEL